MFDPLVALVVSFTVLGIMLFKRVSIGVALVCAGLIMGLLSMELADVIGVHGILAQTTVDPVTVSLVLVTFEIMVLSVLYKETRALESLSTSFRGLLKNPKFIVMMLPAIVGLLPVPGGALMSAPLVEKEAENLGLKEEEKTYLNVWFRHIIFPVYPMSQVLILAAALTATSMASIIVSQIPVVVAMTLTGYFAVLRKPKTLPPSNDGIIQEMSFRRNLTNFAVSFSPILAMILTVALFRLEVYLAALVGILLLILITKPSWKILAKTVSNVTAYKVALAAYGAMLLRSATIASGASEFLGHAITAWNLGGAALLLTLPAALSFLVGSPSGGLAIGIPILAGTFSFDSSSASLLYISAYLGYLAAPTHLCLALTADYFKCPLSKMYRILAPSLAVAFAVSFLVFVAL